MNREFDKAKLFFESGLKEIEKLNFDKAEEEFLQSLKIIPNRSSTMYHLVNIYIFKEKFDKLTSLTNLLLKHFPNEGITKSLPAFSLFNEGKYQASVDLLIDVLNDKINDQDYLILSTFIAQVFRKLKKDSHAIKYYKKILIKEKNPNIYYNIASILSDNRKTKLSIKYFNKSLSLRPKDVSCNWNLALCLLRSQNFEEGFELYEYRWLTKRINKKFTNIKSLFESKEPKNKNILIWSEQGFGDNINFSRFVIDLKNKNNNKIFFATNEGLKELFQFLSNEIHVISFEEAEKISFDFQISLMSLPRYLRIKNTNNINFYKLAINEKDNLQLDKSKKNIGISFSGNTNYYLDHARSIPFKYFEPIIQKKYNFYCLQKDIRSSDLEEFSKHDIKKLGHLGFYELAQYIKNLDFIITIDTSIAHLSGILNKKTFLLLDYNPDWRWFNNFNKTIWYPSFEIIKQKKKNDWKSVIDRVKNL